MWDLFQPEEACRYRIDFMWLPEVEKQLQAVQERVEKATGLHKLEDLQEYLKASKETSRLSQDRAIEKVKNSANGKCSIDCVSGGNTMKNPCRPWTPEGTAIPRPTRTPRLCG